MSAVLKLDQLNLEQGSLDWHRHRSAHANASEAPVIMGASPWEPDTWFKLWQIKTGRALPQQRNSAMQRGLDMERYARAAYEEKTGMIMQPMVMRKNDWLSASLDGISFDNDLILEIKCPGAGEDARLWQQALAGDVPDYCYWQIQHQLYVSGAPLAHLWVFDGANGVLTEVRPDTKNQTRLLREWHRFWSYMATDTPPPLTEQDTLTRNDAVWADAADAYKFARAELQHAEAKAEQSRQRLIGLANHPKVTGAGITVTRFWQEGRVNYAAIPALKDIDLNRYRKPMTQQVRVTLGDQA